MAVFTINDQQSQVFCFKDSLFFQDNVTKKYIDGTSVKCIIAVQYCEQAQYLRIHYVVPVIHNCLRTKVWDFVGDRDSCIQLAQSIQNALQEINRPKRLLIFVNPKAGKENAMTLYTKKVLPLLKLCRIKSDVIEMKTPGLPKEILATYDLSTIQGIVAVGGDGTFSECVNGLLARIQSDYHMDINDSNTPIVASKIPLGIVPAGSGNYLVNYMHGTTDVETTVLKIVLGDQMRTNVVGLYQSKKLTCFATLLLEFGLIGNMMHDCEKFRWMGQSRFNIIPMAALLRRELVDMEIEYQPAADESSRTNYVRHDAMPAQHTSKTRLFQREKSNEETFKSGDKADWKKIDTRAYGVDTYVVTQEEKQGTLVPRFGDHALTMWLTDKCSIKKHVQQLTQLQKAHAGYLNYDFIRKIRTTCYRVKLNCTSVDADGNQHIKKEFYINADGEVIRLNAPTFEVKLHPCSIPVFGTCVG